MFSGKSSATNYHDVFIWYIDRQVFFYPNNSKSLPCKKTEIVPVQKNVPFLEAQKS